MINDEPVGNADLTLDSVALEYPAVGDEASTIERHGVLLRHTDARAKGNGARSVMDSMTASYWEEVDSDTIGSSFNQAMTLRLPAQALTYGGKDGKSNLQYGHCAASAHVA